MSEVKQKTGFSFGGYFAHLADDGGCLTLPVTDTFWSEDIAGLPPGRLVSLMASDADWAVWEMHPAGDEFILQMSGVMTLLFDDGQPPVRLEAGRFAVVPKGAWHTADVEAPGQALFITPGEGTQSRPR